MGGPQQSRETGPGSIPGQGTKIPQAAEYGQKIKRQTEKQIKSNSYQAIENQT